MNQTIQDIFDFKKGEPNEEKILVQAIALIRSLDSSSVTRATYDALLSAPTRKTYDALINFGNNISDDSFDRLCKEVEGSTKFGDFSWSDLLKINRFGPARG